MFNIYFEIPHIPRGQRKKRKGLLKWILVSTFRQNKSKNSAKPYFRSIKCPKNSPHVLWMTSIYCLMSFIDFCHCATSTTIAELTQKEESLVGDQWSLRGKNFFQIEKMQKLLIFKIIKKLVK